MVQQVFHGIANLSYRAGSRSRLQHPAHRGQIVNHPGPLGSIGQQAVQGIGDVGGSELFLNQLRNHSPSGDKVDHPDRQVPVFILLCWNLKGIADKPLGKAIGEGRDAIDDDKWVSNNCSLHRCRPAGHDTGAGMVERLASVVSQGDRGSIADGPK
jgi:hypothetical protein